MKLAQVQIYIILQYRRLFQVMLAIFLNLKGFCYIK